MRTVSQSGGPTFPIPDQGEMGMYKRDYFAAMALQALTPDINSMIVDAEYALLVARTAYKLADAMLAAREA